MYFPYSCWIWNNGGEDKNIPNQGGIPKITRKKITLALLYINYEPSLNLMEAIKTSRRPVQTFWLDFVVLICSYSTDLILLAEDLKCF